MPAIGERSRSPPGPEAGFLTASMSRSTSLATVSYAVAGDGLGRVSAS
jgi:hypothetical protein